MAYDEGLAERLDVLLDDVPGLVVTHMFGGYGFLHNGNMCVGIWKDSLVIRIGIEAAKKKLKAIQVSGHLISQDVQCKAGRWLLPKV